MRNTYALGSARYIPKMKQNQKNQVQEESVLFREYEEGKRERESNMYKRGERAEGLHKVKEGNPMSSGRCYWGNTLLLSPSWFYEFSPKLPYMWLSLQMWVYASA